jgi:probable F420-dependent oxidoreductase
MKVWLTVTPLPTSRLRELVAVAEDLGIDGVALSDHTSVPTTISSLYAASAKPGVIPIDAEFPSPLPMIAALAAGTSRIRFSTHVLLVPLRHPVLLAKEVATVAVVARGRLDLGVGVGWMREEFDSLYVPFEQRGSLMDEALPLLQRLWTGEAVEHTGKHYSFEPIAIHPVPPDSVRLLVGGHSEAAIRRAASLGDGWVGVNPSLEELNGIVVRLSAARLTAGTAERPFEIRTGIRGPLRAESVRALRDLGVESLFVSPSQVVEQGRPFYEISVDEVVERLPRVIEQLNAWIYS